MAIRVFLAMFLTLAATGSAQAAMGAGHGPQSSWNEMQKFEYYLGDLAGALNLCRRNSLYQELRSLAVLTPYGQAGLDAWLAYDAVRGCPGLSNVAEDILKDKDKLLDYLKAKYDCTAGDCVER